jgi:hypothetical protein
VTPQCTSSGAFGGRLYESDPSMPVKAEPHPEAKATDERRRILIVRRPNDSFDRTAYVIHLLIEQWRQWGFTVEVLDQINAAPGPGDVVIPHLDTTCTPPEYETCFARCATVVNRGVTDISKRRISENLVAGPGDYDGPVIVKTDRNFGGQPERERLNNKGRMAQIGLMVARRLPWTLTGMITQYKIFEHTSEVPRRVWHNRSLVVEKFLPEREGGMYCLRQYTFLGSAELNTRAFSADPVVKARTIVKREVLPETPARIREIRKALGFDYGKFDYVMRDGRVVLFDANRTPTYNRASPAGSARPLIVGLAKGIHGFCG